ncbi:DUF6395 domain-containing protein [Arthrobacter sp. Leaf69]|uniref:DUF6395 domain-containing protein n=1 Tax=Arthrobacter sp. Leaf69 TaxID=1736232 RepID=UPI000701C403|nr:DUF6395 domain-containing protein [Arthrobacter sp. Leaf69]KQN95410.1 hypothetical protein ASE96_04430 [Arthrobacter sp. Leaf69]
MQIDVSQVGSELTFTSSLAVDDLEFDGTATMVRPTATFKLPEDFKLDETHPDLIALAGLVIFFPWIGSRLDFGFPVSSGFSEAAAKALNIHIPLTSPRIPKRASGSDARPGLAFSAGVDSMAALAIMPDNTLPMFSYRSAPPPGVGSLYKADAALHAVEEMNAAGNETLLIESDHEWVRGPVGFTCDLAPGLPLILLAGYLKIDAIGFGTIAETAYYATGGRRFDDYAQGADFTKWQAMLHSVDMSFYNGVAGLSEMCTSAIARQYKFGYLAQPCIRGLVGAPCMSCIKCFRKSLIEASMSGDWPAESEVSRMMAAKPIRNWLSGFPISMEVVLAASMSEYQGNDPLLLALQDRVSAVTGDVSFLHSWYGPSIDPMVPERYRLVTSEAMAKYIPKMTAEQEEAFRAFDITPVMDSKEDDVEQFRAVVKENLAQRSQLR